MTNEQEKQDRSMMAASDFIETGARDWQKHFPREPPACYLMACGKFIADSFWNLSDDAFNAFIQQMRDERAQWQERKRREH